MLYSALIVFEIYVNIFFSQVSTVFVVCVVVVMIAGLSARAADIHTVKSTVRRNSFLNTSTAVSETMTK